MYKVYYDLGCNEGWYYENFKDISEALKFANNKTEAEIIKYEQKIPITDNIKMLW